MLDGGDLLVLDVYSPGVDLAETVADEESTFFVEGEGVGVLLFYNVFVLILFPLNISLSWNIRC